MLHVSRQNIAHLVPHIDSPETVETELELLDEEVEGGGPGNVVAEASPQKEAQTRSLPYSPAPSPVPLAAQTTRIRPPSPKPPPPAPPTPTPPPQAARPTTPTPPKRPPPAAPPPPAVAPPAPAVTRAEGTRSGRVAVLAHPDALGRPRSPLPVRPRRPTSGDARGSERPGYATPAGVEGLGQPQHTLAAPGAAVGDRGAHPRDDDGGAVLGADHGADRRGGARDANPSAARRSARTNPSIRCPKRLSRAPARAPPTPTPTAS
jgi:hypothetical protein